MYIKHTDLNNKFDIYHHILVPKQSNFPRLL